MLMLKQLDWCPYWTMASMDSPKGGVSEQDKFQNLVEGATMLDPFEIVLQKNIIKLATQGISGMKSEIAVDKIKPLYQILRHGLAFDWVLNHVCVKLDEYYPFTRMFEFKGTSTFLDMFTDDPVFQAGLSEIYTGVQTFIDWVFEGYEDVSIFRRMSFYAGTQVIEDACEYVQKYPPKIPFKIPFLTSDRVGYLILFQEMLADCIGVVERTTWTDRFNAIMQSDTDHAEMALVVGCRKNAYAYGNIDNTTVKWHRLSLGITQALATRVDRTDVVRVVPDEMSFFKFTLDMLIMDESLVPSVKFFLDTGETEWIDPRQFIDYSDLPINKPLKVSVKYKFVQDPANPKTISIKGSSNTIVKDNLIVLDSDGIGCTQLVFNANTVGFKVADPDKKYPLTFFNNKKVSASGYSWLDDTTDQTSTDQTSTDQTSTDQTSSAFAPN